MTQAQAPKSNSADGLAIYFMYNEDSVFENKDFSNIPVIVPEAKVTSVTEEGGDSWGVGQKQLAAALKSYVSLSHWIAAAEDKLQLPQCSTAYLFD